ncbi:MAG TPA: alpha-amylase family glycosyl hydrolase [Candidatus Acidoferrum sp.]|nr:alpha-amylase family glycosyl hydrolase [Candidatus Acidoferrum sp.]
MILYNLFPLLVGPFARWPEHFARAAGMNFDWVFINPIQQLGASRSLYSIADYFRFNPALLDLQSKASPDEQVRQMIDQAHSAKLQVMIDLVINHCAIDSPLTREHPEWFAHEPDGKIVHSSAMDKDKKVVWADLAQLDYRSTRDPEGLYRYVLSVVEKLLGLGFDGFRCDAAYQVPRAFWERLIKEVKSRHPETCFAAETLGCSADQTLDTARAGFDYVFNSSKWWDLSESWLIEQYCLLRETTRSISFPESHDTPRLGEEMHGNVNGLKQRYLFAALFSAGVMMPIGFEYGFRKALNVVSTTPADWEQPAVDLGPYITKANAIKREHEVFNEESHFNLLPASNPNILLMWKASAKGKEEALLILNKDISQHQEFQCDNFRQYVQAGAPLRDVSPEYPLDYIHEPFHYALRPGQGIVLVTSRS